MKKTIAIALLAFLPGCQLWFGFGNNCDDYGASEPGRDAPGLRDPLSGQCQYFGGGGGGGGGYCDGEPVALAEAEADPAPGTAVDWGFCISECTGLGELSCLSAPTCRAIYLVDTLTESCPPGAACPDVAPVFAECWQMAPSGPVTGGDCAGLDAYSCSLHTDCVAYHNPPGCGADGSGACEPSPEPPSPGTPDGDSFDAPIAPPVVGPFAACGAEPAAPGGCFADEECGPGYVCNAADVCQPPPDCTDPSLPCPAVCYGQCVPATGDPGTCTGDVYCDSLPPTCPEGTVPGILNGCWSGYCIPVSACEQPVACSDMPSEAACIAAAECAPVYAGVDCSCDAAGVCTCSSLDYRGCGDA